MKELILASASPRRKELLQQIGLEFRIITSNKEEIITKNNPADIVMELACIKAEDIYGKEADLSENPDAVVLGADTIVVLDDRVLGKPANKEEAFDMINSIQGRNHAVYTGVCLVYTENGEKKTSCFYEKTEVFVYPMEENEIMHYINTKGTGNKKGVSKWNENSVPFECEDKAGGYGIQGPFAAYIKGIKGDYNNVVGLPVGRVYQELKKINFYNVIPE